MPRRGGGSRAPMRPAARSSVPAPAPRQAAPVPAQAPQNQMMTQGRQPGLFAHMASTAAGVAVGSAVGHTIGAAMTGGGGQSEAAPAPAPVQDTGYQQQQQQFQNPCEMEMKQFLNCAQNQSDMNLCYGFNEALKECKMRFGMQ